VRKANDRGGEVSRRQSGWSDLPKARAVEEASRAAISHGPMRQKNQAKLNRGAGAAEACNTAKHPKSARRKPASKVRRSFVERGNL
jgi:hypothetical protein